MPIRQKFALRVVFLIINTLRFLEIYLNKIFKYTLLCIFVFFIFTFSLNNIKSFQDLLVYYNSDSSSYDLVNDIYIKPNNQLVNARNLPIPYVSSNIVLITNKNNDQVLYEKNSNNKTAPASTAKLLTALVAIDIYSLQEEVLIPLDCTTINATNVGLVYGQSYKVIDLVHALLLNSGADAACTLAISKVSYEDFIKLMNEKAKSFGMHNSNFTNPIGLDDNNGLNYSTASDLYLLSKNSLKNEIIKNIVNQEQYVVKATSSDVTHILNNTNKLLSKIPNSVGVKTGETEAAGEALIYEYVDGYNNIDINIIVVQSLNRFEDVSNLLTWTLGTFEKQK